MKSNESIRSSDYLELERSIYLDACSMCIADVSDLRDLETIRSRVENEGLSFLTITLPQFSKDFERSLELGEIDSSCFRSFRKHGAIPAFLRGMLSRIFNHETGSINDDQEIQKEFPQVISAVRQICLAFKKLEVPCTPEREYAALQNFIETERSFNEFTLPEDDLQAFSLVSSVLWDNMLGDLRLDMLVPRHGPGATADKRVGNHKYQWRVWHERLEPFFPLIDSAYPLSLKVGVHNRVEELKLVTFVSSDEELPVRVTPVPKTLKGPRIIAIEPCCMQYAQQGIRDALYDVIESSNLTRGHINFRDQSVNQTLALISSSDGRLATIDLSDASDRVPRDLALSMFRSNPDLLGAIDACRSTRAQMPDGTVIGPLQKFASMGSALCFPVEAMYFYTICVMALLESMKLPVSHGNVFKVSRDVYVYGDDIIVPAEHAISVLDHLQKYNCKVNTDKTFYRGSFRESCGVDAYNGVAVNPVYIGTTRPRNRQQVSNLVSWVATANLFFKKGYLRTMDLMFKRVESVLGPLSQVPETSAALGRHFPWPSKPPKRWNRHYHRLEEKLWVPRPVYRTGRLEGYGALQKCFLKLRDLKNLSVSRDALHLERFAVHGGLALNRRWVSPTIG